MAFYTIYTFFTYINIILYFHILFQYLMMAIEKNFCIWMAQYLLHIKVPAYVYYKLLLTFNIQIYKSILSAYIKCHIKSKSVSHQQYEKELVLTFHAVISPLLIWILIIWIRFFFHIWKYFWIWLLIVWIVTTMFCHRQYIQHSYLCLDYGHTSLQTFHGVCEAHQYNANKNWKTCGLQRESRPALPPWLAFCKSK